MKFLTFRTTNPGCIRGFSRWDVIASFILFPVLGITLLAGLNRPRDYSELAVCRGQLSRIAQATLMYADDHDGFLPNPNWGSQTEGWLFSQPSLEAESGQLWPYVGSRTQYLCPSDDTNSTYFRLRDLSGYQSSSSYLMNAAVNGYGSPKGFESVGTFRIQQFRPDAVVYIECDEEDPFYFNDGSVRPDEGLTKKHLFSGGHVASFDGSVEFMTRLVYYDEAGIPGTANRGVKPGRLWCSPDSQEGGTF